MVSASVWACGDEVTSRLLCIPLVIGTLEAFLGMGGGIEAASPSLGLCRVLGELVVLVIVRLVAVGARGSPSCGACEGKDDGGLPEDV